MSVSVFKLCKRVRFQGLKSPYCSIAKIFSGGYEALQLYETSAYVRYLRDTTKKEKKRKTCIKYRTQGTRTPMRRVLTWAQMSGG